MIVTLISDATESGDQGGPVDQSVTVDDVKKWSEDYGITFPVLVDSEWQKGTDLWPKSWDTIDNWGNKAPQYMVLKPGMEIIRTNLWEKIGDFDPEDYGDGDDIQALDEYFIEKILPK